MFRRLVCMCGLFCVVPAHASDDDLFDLGLEDLMNIKVKSASLFEESRMNAAATIDKVDASDWERWGARNNVDAFRTLPSVQSYPTLFGGYAVAIRGYARSLSTRGIATLIDGIPVNEFIFGSAQYERERISLGVVDSIELIKGPGSTLYGSDAFHSSIQFNTFYSDKDSASLNAQLGTYDYRQVNSKVSQQLTSDVLLNVAFDYREQGVWEWPYTNINTHLPDVRDNQFDTSTVNIKLHNFESDDWYYRLQFHHNTFDGDGFLGGGDANGYQDKDISSSENSFDLWDGLLEHKLSPEIKVGLRTFHWDVNRLSLFESRLGRRKYDQELSKEQLQLYTSYETDSGSRLFVGAETSRQTVDKAYLSLLNQDNSLQTFTVQSEDGAVRRINSIFAQGRWVTDWQHLEIEAGIRSDDYTEFGRQNSPRLAFILPFDKSHVAKLIYGNAFRAPVTSELYGTATIRGDRNIKPEDMNSYEAVWMVTNEHTAYQISTFYNRWKNGIVAIPIVDPVYTSEYQNIGNNNSRGVEAAYKIVIGDTLIQADVAHVFSSNQLNNKDYDAFPRWSMHLDVGHQITAKQSVHLRWSDDFHWNSNSNTNTPAMPLAARYTIDVAYEYNLSKQVQILANCNNLLNRKNYTPSVRGNPEGDRDPERELNVQLHYSFD